MRRHVERKYQVEIHSLKLNGIASCQMVRGLIRLQRLETEADTSERTGQPMPNHVYIDGNEY